MASCGNRLTSPSTADPRMNIENHSSDSSPSDDSLDYHKVSREQDRDFLQSIRYDRTTLDFLLNRKERTPLALSELLSQAPATIPITPIPRFPNPQVPAPSPFQRRETVSPSPPSKVAVVKRRNISIGNTIEGRGFPAVARSPEKRSLVQRSSDPTPFSDSITTEVQHQQRRPFNMSTTLFKILIFTGIDLENENPSRFLKQVEYSFAPSATQYATEGLDLNIAKAFYLECYTSHKAATWVNDLTDELLGNWRNRSERFVQDFR